MARLATTAAVVLALCIIAVLPADGAAAAPEPAVGPSPTPAATTTIAPLGGRLPTPVATVPFETKPQSAHVDPLLAYLSGVGFFVALVIIAVQFLLTRPNRRGRRTL